MNDNKSNSLQDILKEILAKDINLLNSRNELINKVKAQISGNDIREFSAIQKALQSNVGELFLKATLENTDEAKEQTKEQVHKILQEQNIQEKRIQMVIATFIYALDWNKLKEEKPEFVTTVEQIEPEEIEDTPVVEPVQQNTIKPGIIKPIVKQKVQTEHIDDMTWQCSCGTKNTQVFCIKCGETCPIYILEKFAKQGNAIAQNNLAVCYRDGKGVVANQYKALELFQQSAQQKYVWGEYNLAEFYYDISKNADAAFYWYKQAAEHNLPEAQYMLSFCYEFKIGTEQDKQQSLYWLKKAAANNLEKAKLKLLGYQDTTPKIKLQNSRVAKSTTAKEDFKLGCGFLTLVAAIIAGITTKSFGFVLAILVVSIIIFLLNKDVK